MYVTFFLSDPTWQTVGSTGEEVADVFMVLFIFQIRRKCYDYLTLLVYLHSVPRKQQQTKGGGVREHESESDKVQLAEGGLEHGRGRTTTPPSSSSSSESSPRRNSFMQDEGRE